MFEKPLRIGTKVRKSTGDYKFVGYVVAAFLKRDGLNQRVVVENKDGILHIFNPTQLKKV